MAEAVNPIKLNNIELSSVPNAEAMLYVIDQNGDIFNGDFEVYSSEPSVAIAKKIAVPESEHISAQTIIGIDTISIGYTQITVTTSIGDEAYTAACDIFVKDKSEYPEAWICAEEDALTGNITTDLFRVKVKNVDTEAVAIMIKQPADEVTDETVNLRSSNPAIATVSVSMEDKTAIGTDFTVIPILITPLKAGSIIITGSVSNKDGGITPIDNTLRLDVTQANEGDIDNEPIYEYGGNVMNNLVHLTQTQLGTLVTKIFENTNTRINERIVQTLVAGDTKHVPSADAVSKLVESSMQGGIVQNVTPGDTAHTPSADAVSKAILAMNHWNVVAVTGELPTGSDIDEKTIYLVRSSESDQTWEMNVYADVSKTIPPTEDGGEPTVTTEKAWVNVGNTSIDLANYLSNEAAQEIYLSKTEAAATYINNVKVAIENLNETDVNDVRAKLGIQDPEELHTITDEQLNSIISNAFGDTAPDLTNTD